MVSQTHSIICVFLFVADLSFIMVICYLQCFWTVNTAVGNILTCYLCVSTGVSVVDIPGRGITAVESTHSEFWQINTRLKYCREDCMNGSFFALANLQ